MPVDTADPVARAFHEAYGHVVGHAPLLDDDPARLAAAGPPPRRHRPARSALAAAAVVLLAIGGVALLMAPRTLRPFVGEPPAPDIIAFMADGADHGPVRAALEHPAITGWELYTKADALEEAREMFADDPQLLAMIEQNPDVLPESYRIRAHPAWWPALVAEFEAIPGVRLVMTDDELEERRADP